jgi:hypothetical protein
MLWVVQKGFPFSPSLYSGSLFFSLQKTKLGKEAGLWRIDYEEVKGDELCCLKPDPGRWYLNGRSSPKCRFPPMV